MADNSSNRNADDYFIPPSDRRYESIVGDGNVIGNGNKVTVIKQRAGDNAIQIGQARDINIDPPTSPASTQPAEVSIERKATLSSRGVDFVLVTALEEERDAVLDKLPGYRKLSPLEDDIRTYFQAELPVIFPDGEAGTYRVIVMPLLGMGRLQAATATKDAIAQWHPRYVVLVGIAGGLAAQGVSIGDILIADQIVDYELQKLTPQGPQVRWEVHRADPRLLNACENFMGEDWLKMVRVERPDQTNPKRHTGPIASGDKVVAFGDVLDRYREVWPKLIGVEMEAAGVATTAFQSPAPPGFFMVCCVSDLADEHKGSVNVKKWRAYACDAAASFAIALLKSGPVPLSNENAASVESSLDNSRPEYVEPIPARADSPKPLSIVVSLLAALLLGFISSVLANMWQVKSPQSLLIAVGAFGLIFALGLWAEFYRQGAPLAGLFLFLVRASTAVGALCLISGLGWAVGALLLPLTPTVMPTSTPTELPVPTPQKTGKVHLYDDFTNKVFWTVGNDTDGQSWYGEGGYNVLSRTTKRGWMWILPKTLREGDLERSFTDAIIEVDVTPITDGRVTGYGLVAGWERGGSQYLFEVRPNGDCSFVKFEAMLTTAPDSELGLSTCPQPTQNKTVNIRLEIQGGHMIAFIDHRFMTQYTFPDYHGGLIGLEAYNDGVVGSGVETQVRFDNLIVWDLP